MTTPTEINKQDIIRVALARIGDTDRTWEYLKMVDAVRPPRKKYSITVEVTPTNAVNADLVPQWKAENLGRAIYRGAVGSSITEVKDVSEPSPEVDPNTGTVPLAQFMEFAKAVKKGEGYCWEFWAVVRREFGVPEPQRTEKVQVTLTITPDEFRNAGIEPDSDINQDVLRAVLRHNRLNLATNPA